MWRRTRVSGPLGASEGATGVFSARGRRQDSPPGTAAARGAAPARPPRAAPPRPASSRAPRRESTRPARRGGVAGCRPRLRAADGFIARVDFADPELRLAIEDDGLWH